MLYQFYVQMNPCSRTTSPLRQLFFTSICLTIFRSQTCRLQELTNDIKLGCLTFFILLVCLFFFFFFCCCCCCCWQLQHIGFPVADIYWFSHDVESSTDLWIVHFFDQQRNQPRTDSVKSSVDGSLFLHSGEHPVHDSVESAVGGYLFAQSGFRCLSDLKVKPCIAASQVLSQYVYGEWCSPTTTELTKDTASTHTLSLYH